MTGTWEWLTSKLDRHVWAGLRLDSPIERAFFRCFHYVMLEAEVLALRLEPQVQIDEFRVDFVITNTQGERLLVVECDGHDFHERTREQAARDKSRDRSILLNHKLPVMRFTGSEIYADPFECALQAIATASKAGTA